MHETFVWDCVAVIVITEPVTAIFCVVAPCEPIVMFPLDVPLADDAKRTYTVVADKAPEAVIVAVGAKPVPLVRLTS